MRHHRKFGRRRFLKACVGVAVAGPAALKAVAAVAAEKPVNYFLGGSGWKSPLVPARVVVTHGYTDGPVDLALAIPRTLRHIRDHAAPGSFIHAYVPEGNDLRHWQVGIDGEVKTWLCPDPNADHS